MPEASFPSISTYLVLTQIAVPSVDLVLDHGIGHCGWARIRLEH